MNLMLKKKLTDVAVTIFLSIFLLGVGYAVFLPYYSAYSSLKRIERKIDMIVEEYKKDRKEIRHYLLKMNKLDQDIRKYVM